MNPALRQRNTEVSVLTVADLHQSAGLYAGLRRAVERHRPDIVALVGDCLHAGEDMKGRLAVADCARKLESLPAREIIFVRGNHEDANWIEFKQNWPAHSRPLRSLHGETFKYGPLCLVGFPCYLGDESAFVGTKPALFEPDDWLKPLLRLHGRSMRTLWLMHEPPVNTPLSAPHSIVAGNPFWNDAINSFVPRLTVSGHDHITPIKNKRWHHKLGGTTCINVGQSDHGPLHYSLIQATFDSLAAPFPETLLVTAYPAEETIRC